MRSVQLLAATALAIALSVTSATAQKKYDVGATDTEIKIGQTVPFSGPASAYAGIGKTQAAYIKMINEQGGINGRKLNLIQYDDAYSPPKAVEQVRKLVEGDEVLFTFQIIGTPSNAAVQKYLNARKVPQLLASTGASRFSDPQNAPWTIAFNPNYQSEGRIYAKYILANHPNAKIGIFYQNDDLGRDYITGLKSGLGDKAASMIVTEVSYELTDPTVDSQIVKLKAAGVDLVYDASTPKFAAQAIRKIADLNWNPVHILDINASPVSATLKPRRSRHLQGHHLDQLRQGSRRPAMEGRSRREGLFRVHGQVLSGRRQAQHRQHLRLLDGRAADPGAQAVRRRPHPREPDEAGDQPEEVRAEPRAAGHVDHDGTERLPHQQADADDEVQRRALGAVRPDHRGHRTGGLAVRTELRCNRRPPGRRFVFVSHTLSPSP
ncbi:ABC-type branched-subunit amino acid transport system substrate-binding protein [Bradyrhizobium elkanii]